MENLFLTLYFYNELAAGPVVGSVISSVTNHVFSLWKVRARFRASKYQPTWDRVKEPLRKVTLRTGIWGTSSLYHQSVWFSVGYLSAWHLWLTWWWYHQQNLSPGVGPSILEQSVSLALPSSHGSGDNGSWGDLCLPRSEIKCWLMGPLPSLEGTHETIPHHRVGKRCSSRCPMKPVRPDSKGSDCFVKPVPRVPPFAASGNAFCSGHNARLALCSRTTGSNQHLPTHTGSAPLHRPSSMQIRLRSPSKW